MKRKWYKYTRVAQLNSGEKHTIDYSNYYYYLTEEEVKEKTQLREIHNFEYAKLCSQGSMEHYMDYKPKTWYRKKEKIGFRLSSWWNDYEGHQYLTKEEFKSYIVYDDFEPLNIDNYSLEDLLKHSSANDFVNYMKDNNIATCPMINN